jgi:hypothetical protein
MKLSDGRLSRGIVLKFAHDVGEVVGNHRFGVRVSRQPARKSKQRRQSKHGKPRPRAYSILNDGD